MNETCFEFLSVDEHATFCSSDRMWRNRIEKLAEQYPDRVQVMSDSHGMLLAHVPKDWFKVNPPVKRTYSPERLEASRAQMKALRAEQLAAHREQVAQKGAQAQKVTTGD